MYSLHSFAKKLYKNKKLHRTKNSIQYIHRILHYHTFSTAAVKNRREVFFAVLF